MKAVKQQDPLPSNDKLVENIRNGNAEAFEKLFRFHYTGLQRFLWGYVKCSHIAEELVQEVFVRIWEKRRTLNPNENVKTYLYKIGRNLAIDHLRHQKIVHKWEKEKKALRSYSVIRKKLDDKVHKKLILKEVRKAITNLPERRRQVFILSRYEGMSYKEIAEVLEISVNTVETQISRALSTLRDKFSEHL